MPSSSVLPAIMIFSYFHSNSAHSAPSGRHRLSRVQPASFFTLSNMNFVENCSLYSKNMVQFTQFYKEKWGLFRTSNIHSATADSAPSGRHLLSDVQLRLCSKPASFSTLFDMNFAGNCPIYTKKKISLDSPNLKIKMRPGNALINLFSYWYQLG